MPSKGSEKKGEESNAGNTATETKNPVPGGFNEETFQLKATNGRKFPTNIVSRILFHDATKRLLTHFLLHLLVVPFLTCA